MRDMTEDHLIPEERPGIAVADPTWERLEDQIGWYDTKSLQAQRWYKRLKLGSWRAAVLPPIAGLGGSPLLVSLFSSAIVVLEGVQHLFQYHEHWITYRFTCEALRHERYLCLAAARPPYIDSDKRRALLPSASRA
jgi:hypothetical protein